MIIFVGLMLIVLFSSRREKRMLNAVLLLVYYLCLKPESILDIEQVLTILTLFLGLFLINKRKYLGEQL